MTLSIVLACKKNDLSYSLAQAKASNLESAVYLLGDRCSCCKSVKLQPAVADSASLAKFKEIGKHYLKIFNC